MLIIVSLKKSIFSMGRKLLELALGLILVWLRPKMESKYLIF